MALNETLLAELRNLPMPDTLHLLDDAVLADLRERQQMGSVSRTALGACSAIALGIGLASGAMTSAPALAGESSLSLTSASALAPSNLLDSSQ
jgi:hypothetical protein